MILHSLEDLECLLPDDMREKVRKEKAKQAAELPPFNFMKTENRVLPLLPRWMKNKLVEAKILYDHNNTSILESLKVVKMMIIESLIEASDS